VTGVKEWARAAVNPSTGFLLLLIALEIADARDSIPHSWVLVFAFSGATFLVIYTKLTLTRRQEKGPYQRAAEAEEELEKFQLRVADELLRLRTDLLKKQMIETRPHAREVLSAADEMVEKVFERVAPEKWAEELAKWEAEHPEAFNA
jgi:hypothetical protein